MAFVIDYLTNIRGQDKANDVQGLWAYRTTDARATVEAANYFLNGKTLVRSTDTTLTASTSTQKFIDKFYIGDRIFVEQVDSDNNVLDSYELFISVLIKGADPLIVAEAQNPGEIVAFGKLADISTASNETITFGQEVELVSVETYLGGEIATADDTITVSIGSTALEGGSITVAYSGSALGDKDSCSPYGDRTGTAFKVASDGSSTNTVSLYVVMRGRVVEGQVMPVVVRIPDISSANSADYQIAPVAGTVVKCESVLQTAITSADATLTCRINGTGMTNGTITVAHASSAAGDVDSCTPSAANTVDEGDVLSAISDGGSSTTASAYVTFYILR